MPLKNDRLIRALLRQPVDRTPVWIMRQAGRYLPEYRAVRRQVGDFLTLCKTPELACKVTLQPFEWFDLDAAILFSDILTIPDAMGLGLYFADAEGPKFERPITSRADIDRLTIPDPDTDLDYVVAAVKLIKQALAQRVPLIGFAGSPWTLACYMVEGGASKTFSKIKGMLYRDPASLHRLLDKLTDATVLYLTAQIEAGVDVIQIFDTWGGVLSDAAYTEFSLDYMQKIISRLPKKHQGRRIPSIIFTKGGGLWLEKIAATGCDAIGLDWSIDIGDAKRRVGDKVALQGNLDPCVLYADAATIAHHVQHILSQFGDDTGHVFNLGHGIYPDIAPEKLQVLIETVRQFRH